NKRCMIIFLMKLGLKNQLNVTDRKTGQTSTIQVSGLQNNSTDF
ncbi:hypothetical protein ACUOA8_34630, partial [Escherichia sp. SS-MK2]